MEEFKDKCQGLEVRLEEIGVDLQELPTDYKLAERYTDIDQEVYEMLEWYERIKREKLTMEKHLKRVDRELRMFNNDVQNLKLREFSRAQHGGSYSQLSQIPHR
jgi:chromosome segregation ATPase